MGCCEEGKKDNIRASYSGIKEIPFKSRKVSMKFLIFLILLSFPAVAKTYKIKVFAEPGSESKALEYIQNMREIEPFAQLLEKKAIIIDQTPVMVTGINCRGGAYGIPRLAQCDLDKVQKACGDYDLCPVYTSFPNIGAGNQRYPIVSSSFPWTTMLHEVVHTYGFTDEYAYTKSETKTYCPNKVSWINGHSNISEEEIFDDKKSAENSCKKNIPWCKFAIESGTEVVQKNADGKYKIGSPTPSSCPNVTIGVYAGGSCQAKSPAGTWRPYFCPTVMGYPSLGEEFCEVSRRHKIIRNSPNLLPDYYQMKIFNKIMTASDQDLQFENKTTPDLEHHAYGIPEIDILSGHDGEENFCKESRSPSSVKKNKKDPHADCFTKLKEMD